MSFLSDILPTGVDITFLGHPRKVCFIRNYDINDNGEVALELKYVQGFRGVMKTGYIFNISDFSPTLDSFNLQTSLEPLVCWKSLDGKSDAMPVEIKIYQEREKYFRQLINLYKVHLAEMIQVVEGKISTETRKREVIEGAKSLKAIKEIAAQTETKVVRGPGGRGDGGFDMSSVVGKG